MEFKLTALKAFNVVCVGMTVLFFFGLGGNSTLFTQLNLTVKCLVAAWLLYRFYNKSSRPFTEFDRHACVTSGAYILLASMADLVNVYVTLYRSTVMRM